MSDTVIRALSSAPEIVNGIRSGLYTVWGGVVRVAKGHKGGGRIVGHLQFPSDSNQASDAISRLQQALSASDGVQDSLSSLQNLQYANLALSGLNLAVSAAGFAIVCRKLNGISDQMDAQSGKLDLLLEMALDARAREGLRDSARFRAAVKTVRVFTELGDKQGLRTQVANLHEQYEFSRMTLNRAAKDVTSGQFLDRLGVLKSLQDRMMYLAFLQSFVQQRTDAPQFAIETLRELQTDWLEVNTALVETVSENQDWVDGLTSKDGDNIVSFLKYRQDMNPAVEYQASLLEFTGSDPQVEQLRGDGISEIYFLAA